MKEHGDIDETYDSPTYLQYARCALGFVAMTPLSICAISSLNAFILMYGFAVATSLFDFVWIDILIPNYCCGYITQEPVEEAADKFFMEGSNSSNSVEDGEAAMEKHEPLQNRKVSCCAWFLRKLLQNYLVVLVLVAIVYSFVWLDEYNASGHFRCLAFIYGVLIWNQWCIFSVANRDNDMNTIDGEGRHPGVVRSLKSNAVELGSLLLDMAQVCVLLYVQS